MEIEGVPGAQVLVQVEQEDRSYARTAWGNVPVARCASIVLTGAPARCRALAAAIDAAVVASGRDVVPITPPAPASNGAILNAGFADPKCQKLLVLVSDGANAVADPPFAAPWKGISGSPGGDYSVLPVLPETARTSFAALIPAAYGAKNAKYWNASIDETVPAVFAAAAMTVEVPRLFISYRQKESAALAVSLFDALSHAGYDVFLDHYRIPPAANFQERLTQELGDKSMVVVLESTEILASEWTLYEINTAKTCELTVAAVHLPKGKKVTGVDDAARHQLTDADFEGGAFTRDAVLRPDALAALVTWIDQEHNQGVLRRRGALRAAIENALLLRGVTAVTTDPAGMMQVKAAGKEYRIWPSTRSPELNDFHTTSLSTTVAQRAAVIGLASLFMHVTRARYDWLAGVSHVAMIDKGEIGAAAERISRGDPLS